MFESIDGRSSNRFNRFKKKFVIYLGFVIADFERELNKLEGIKVVHDLHVWALSVGKPAMSAHIVSIEKSEIVLERATRLCR